MILLEIKVSDLFTYGSFTTLAGTTGIVYITCGAIQHAFNYNPKWLALLVSMIVSFIAAYIGTFDAATAKETAMDVNITYLLAFLNGFLIYMTATGTNQVFSEKPAVNPPSTTPSPNNGNVKKIRRFNSSWWKK